MAYNEKLGFDPKALVDEFRRRGVIWFDPIPETVTVTEAQQREDSRHAQKRASEHRHNDKLHSNDPTQPPTKETT